MKLDIFKQVLILVFVMNKVTFATECKRMLVQVPVSNLYTMPQKNIFDLSPPLIRHDNPGQLSQILFGEQVLVHKLFTDNNNQQWLYVFALQQDIMPKLKNYQRTPCPGWILAQDVIAIKSVVPQNLIVSSLQAPLLDENQSVVMMLSIGSRLSGERIIDTGWKVSMPDGTVAYIDDKYVYHYTDELKESCQQLRQQIISNAKKFLHSFYSWGSRSGQSEHWHPSSVDCSGLVNISFLSQGLHIPKNSHSQYLSSEHLSYGCDLQVGDLVFMAPRTSGERWMSHVMLYAGDDMLLEAAASSKKVQEITFLQKFGKKYSELQSGDVVTQLVTDKQYHIYFGSYLSDDMAAQKLRSDMFLYASL